MENAQGMRSSSADLQCMDVCRRCEKNTVGKATTRSELCMLHDRDGEVRQKHKNRYCGAGARSDVLVAVIVGGILSQWGTPADAVARKTVAQTTAEHAQARAATTVADMNGTTLLLAQTMVLLIVLGFIIGVFMRLSNLFR